ncbi:MFS transporter [Pseudochelatococcus sp. B33]
MNRTVPLILAVALFMENMDSMMIATSLPAIAADLKTSPIALKLAFAAYFVSLAIFIPVSAWMADKFGAKRVFRVAIGIFIVGSVLCAVSGSLTAFVISRFVQGMGGAMMTPVARIILVRITQKRDLLSAITWLTFPALVGPLLGPPVGGFITTFFSWHWIFLINVPIGLLGILVTGTYLPHVPPTQVGSVDFTGFTLSAVAASGIVFGLSVISLPALPPVAGVATTVAGLAALALYVRHARRCPHPILDLTLFSNLAYRTAVAGGSVFRVGNGALTFLLPLMLQLGFGLSPLESGMLTFATAIGSVIVKMMIRFLLRTGGFRMVLIASGILSGIFIAIIAGFTPSTPAMVIIAVFVVVGFARSIFFTSLTSLTFSEVDEHSAGQAAAISAVTQQVSIALGVAVGGGVLEVVSDLSDDGTITLAAFKVAILIVAGVTALASIFFFRLAPDAGSDVSGHRPRILSPARPDDPPTAT